jgi:hypothetical protein
VTAFAIPDCVVDAPDSAADAAYEDALSNLFDCGTTKAPPWQALVTALAAIRPPSIGKAIDWLVEHRVELEAAYAGGLNGPMMLPQLTVDLVYEPELGVMDRARDNHTLRGRSLFDDLVGRRTWMQAVVFAITGIELAESDARLLEAFAVANILVDRRAWPMAITRRVGGRGNGLAAAVLAGVAAMESPVLAGAAAGNCARFLQAAAAAQARGQSVAATVAEYLGRRERVMGFGRPLVGADERVPIMNASLERHGRAHGKFITILRLADDAFAAQKGLRTTSAAWAAALLSDLGVDPAGVHAVCNYWVTLNVFCQAAFSAARSSP